MTPDLTQVLAQLATIAPLRLAGDWDNVGLLLEGTREITRIGLTIDLTAAVADELLASECDLIVAYHPPIFRGLKRVTEATPRGATLLRLIRAGVHVYSPHTALDAAAGGMAEWLLEPLGELRDVAPIEPDSVQPEVGSGRRATLVHPTPLSELVPTIRDHLGLDHVRVAVRGHPTITTVAVCPGAGGSVFTALGPTDLLLTGEMRHHDVLARYEAGSAVILTDHTNTERGYLPHLATRLGQRLALPVVISGADRDPLVVL